MPDAMSTRAADGDWSTRFAARGDERLRVQIEQVREANGIEHAAQVLP
jgi:hypothetical protein